MKQELNAHINRDPFVFAGINKRLLTQLMGGEAVRALFTFRMGVCGVFATEPMSHSRERMPK